HGVSILKGIQQRAGQSTRVVYAEGTDPVSAGDFLPGPPPIPSAVLSPDAPMLQGAGLRAEYWSNPRFEGESSLVRLDRTVNVSLVDLAGLSGSSQVTSDDLQHSISVRWSGQFTAPADGTYRLSLTHWGTARLFIDGEQLLEDPGVELATQTVELQCLAGAPH